MNPKKENILKAASRIFAENGFERAVLDDIAKAADVGKGTLYQYFKDKENLFISVFEFNMERLAQTLIRQLEDIDNPVKRIIEGVRFYMAFFEEHPELIDLTAHERSSFGHRLSNNYFEQYSRYFEKGITSYKQALDEGYFKAYSQEDLMITMTGAMNKFIYFWQRGCRQYNLASKAEVVINIILKGILTDKGKEYLKKVNNT